MKGHIRERSPSHYAIVLELRDPETGKRRRKWHSFVGTKREAQRECARLIAAMTGGDYVEPAKVTLGAFLDRWLEHVQNQVSPKTHERYGQLARNNLVPLLGLVPVTKLQPAQISSAYAKVLADGRRKGDGGLSPRTVHHMHRVLRQALQQALRWNLLARNPADAVRPPKVERKPILTLSAAQSAELLERIRHSRVYWPSMVALATGMRRGEILALRWKNVDLDRAVLHVVESVEQTKGGIRFKPPKNGRTRAVTLPAFAVRELRRLKIEQAQELLRIGIRQSSDTLLCGRADGDPHQPNSLTYEFARFIADMKDMPRVRFHDLRHSHATQLLATGCHPKIAQERLGHAGVSITLDLYSHVTATMQADAAERVDSTIGSALDKLQKLRGGKG
jgi:integrase